VYNPGSKRYLSLNANTTIVWRDITGYRNAVVETSYINAWQIKEAVYMEVNTI